MRRLPIVLTVVLATLAVVVPCAAAKPITIESMHLYRPTSGTGAGQFIAVVRVSTRGAVSQREQYAANGRLRRLRGVLTLRDGDTTITTADTVQLKPRAYAGQTALLYFAFPKTASAKLSADAQPTPSLTVALQGHRQTPVAHPRRAATARQWGFPCFIMCDPDPAPAPPAPVAFAQTSGNAYAQMCVFFNGPGQAGPYVETIWLSTSSVDSWLIFADQGSDIAVSNSAYSGSAWVQGPFSLTAPVAGYAVTVSGIIPPSTLSSGSGAATISYSGDAVGGIPTTFSDVTVTSAQVQNC